MTLTFNPLRAIVITYSQAKVQGQRSVGSEDRLETSGRTDGQTDRQQTDRWTDGDNCITSVDNAAGNAKVSLT